MSASINQQKSPSGRILAVDDSPDNLFLIQAILADDYQLSFAESGQEAIARVHQERPDLILLDIMMPEMNGYEVTQKIRQDESLPYIPILLLTAHNSVSLVEGLDVGADDFIHKPFDIEELGARVRSLLRLKQAMDAQASIIKQRDDFVARLTHDLRTPLVAATRMLQFCIDGNFGLVAEDAKQALAETIQSNEQLLSMVNMLLEVYRHESGHKALTIQSLNLCELAIAVVNELSPLVKGQPVSCQVTDTNGDPIQDCTPFQMRGDVLELRRTVTNLVANAMKFTDRGSVTVQLQRCASAKLPSDRQSTAQTDCDWLVLSVIDTGIGISSEDLSKIFQWFRQGTQRRAGSGLGLHLASRIARLHGGWIDVTSTAGQGSTFSLYLPTEINEE